MLIIGIVTGVISSLLLYVTLKMLVNINSKYERDDVLQQIKWSTLKPIENINSIEVAVVNFRKVLYLKRKNNNYKQNYDYVNKVNDPRYRPELEKMYNHYINMLLNKAKTL